MKKELIILLSVCSVAILVWVSSGFSWTVYSGGCGDCHGGAADVHPDHDAVDCTTCHVGAPPYESPATSTCTDCHPLGDSGKCPLVIGHEDSPSYDPQGASCITCHAAECDDPEPECESDSDCDDGVFCNGIESCSSEGSVCVDGPGDPCEEGETCNEETDTCDAASGCTEDADCDDGDLCTTDECIDDECVNTEVDCGDEICDPADGLCVECLIDGDCDEGEICSDNICIVEDCPEGTPEKVLLFDEDGDCLLNKDELKKYKDSLKDIQKQEKDNLKNKQNLDKTEYKLIKTNFSTK